MTISADTMTDACRSSRTVSYEKVFRQCFGQLSTMDERNFLSTEAHACLWNDDENARGCIELDDAIWFRLPKHRQFLSEIRRCRQNS